MACVLVTRPQPLADETAARLRALGHDVIVSPLLEPMPLDWEAPTAPADAIAFTSPQAPRLAGPNIAALRTLPVFAVGERTSRAAREAGFTDVRHGGGDATTLFAAMREAGFRRVLHLAGRDRVEASLPHDLEIFVRAVYEARLVAGFTSEAQQALRAGSVDWALLFSARTARHFATLHDRTGAARADVGVAAISSAVLDAAGAGWRDRKAAPAPAEAHLLAAAGLSCDKPQGTNGQEH